MPDLARPINQNATKRKSLLNFAAMTDSDFDRIKKSLDALHDWPTVYMFKFIVPSDNKKIALVEALFDSDTAQIRRKQSAKGNYTSLTVREVMTDADTVLDRYKKASEIEGLIAL